MGMCSCIVRGSFGTRVWKEIRKEQESFFPNILCSLGNGRVPFWKDWCREKPLSAAFPSLFALAGLRGLGDRFVGGI